MKIESWGTERVLRCVLILGTEFLEGILMIVLDARSVILQTSYQYAFKILNKAGVFIYICNVSLKSYSYTQ